MDIKQLIRETNKNHVKNLIRIGNVSAVHEADGTVEVTFPDKNDIVTDPLPMLAFEYYMPSVGDKVLCIFLGNGFEAGICLGKFFCNPHPAYAQNKDIYYKDFFGDASIQYNKATKTLSIDADNIIVNGILLTVNGNQINNGSWTLNGSMVGGVDAQSTITLTGTIDLTGSITTSGNITSSGQITGNTVFDSQGNLRTT